MERAATHERPTAYDVASTHERAATDAGALHRRNVYKQVLAAALRLDEAVRAPVHHSALSNEAGGFCS